MSRAGGSSTSVLTAQSRELASGRGVVLSSKRKGDKKCSQKQGSSVLPKGLNVKLTAPGTNADRSFFTQITATERWTKEEETPKKAAKTKKVFKSQTKYKV